MSSNVDPVCTRCKTTSSLIWQRDQKGAVICLECHSTEKSASKTTNFGSEPQTSGKQSSVHKTLLRMSQPASSSSSSSSSASSSSSSLADVSVSGVTTRRTTRSHERAKAKQQQQLQQGSVLVKLEANGRNADESENTSIDELLNKDKSKSVVCELLNKCTPQDSPGNKVEGTTMQSPGYGGGPPSPGFSTSSRHCLRQGQPMQAPKSQPYILTCSSVQHQVGHPGYYIPLKVVITALVHLHHIYRVQCTKWVT